MLRVDPLFLKSFFYWYSVTEIDKEYVSFFSEKIIVTEEKTRRKFSCVRKITIQFIACDH